MVSLPDMQANWQVASPAGLSSPFPLLTDKNLADYKWERQLGAGDQRAALESDTPCFVLVLPFVSSVNFIKSLSLPEASVSSPVL